MVRAPVGRKVLRMEAVLEGENESSALANLSKARSTEFLDARPRRQHALECYFNYRRREGAAPVAGNSDLLASAEFNVRA